MQKWTILGQLIIWLVEQILDKKFQPTFNAQIQKWTILGRSIITLVEQISCLKYVQHRPRMLINFKSEKF